MYLGKYPDPSELPPGYRGVALSAEPCESCERECPEKREELSGECERKCEKHDECEKSEKCEGRGGFLDKIFSHKLDIEDLLLLALLVMLISSGADIEIILMLALLFVFGL